LESRLENVIEDIQDSDVRGELVSLELWEVSLRKDLFDEFWKLQKLKEANLFQRSRSKWLCEGDANSKFFHGCVKARAKRNAISAIKVGIMWINSPIQIQEVVVNFFTTRFTTLDTIRQFEG
jgi:hypothetical protein